MPEVRCPTGSDENWQRVDDERGEEREWKRGQGDQDGGFWLKRGERREGECCFETQCLDFKSLKNSRIFCQELEETHRSDIMV